MGRLRYATICSLDGYVADASGDFQWAAPDAEVHAFVNDLERDVGTYLYGRRIYEVMTVWQDWPAPDDDEPAEVHDYARLWRAADKVVYSTTLAEVGTARTQLRRRFDPAEVRELLDAAEHDVSISGPTLAAAALHAGLVDDVTLLLLPEIVGGGTPALPDELRLGLELVDVRRFGSGVVMLAYVPRR